MIEIAGIIVLGIFAQWLAWKTKIPAILPLILIGMFMGPVSEMIWGEKLIHPVYENGKGFFPNTENLFYFVSLAIGIILFEGGLTLKFKEVTNVGSVILKLLTIGSLITFIGGGFSALFLLSELGWKTAFLFSALIIVTGPTVIVPILQNVPLNKNVSTVLKWEGILIDPIGALVAVLVFEFILTGASTNEYTSTALFAFGKIVAVGTLMGLGAALFLYYFIKNELVPHYLLNVFTLALVLGAFAFADEIVHESGLLTVVVMGMALANLKVPYIKDILYFKESLTVLLISLLFILLSANITPEQLYILLDWRCLALFGVVVLVLRPMSVFLSTIRSDLSFREKLFISWVGPRGIVAAGIASLFGLGLTGQIEGAEYVTPLVFMVVLGTVLLNATTAKFVANLLKVTLESSDGYLIIGANKGARLIASYLKQNDIHVVLLDNSAKLIEKAEALGLEVIQENIYTDGIHERYDLLDISHIMAVTGSEEVNKYACRTFRKSFGEKGAYRLQTDEESKVKIKGAQLLFNDNIDYITFIEVARDFPDIHEMSLTSSEDLLTMLDKMSHLSIPIFIKNKESIEVFTTDYGKFDLGEDTQLVYMGKKIELGVLA